jgi:ergothioneine biosynthesis protein EgtB
MHSRLPKYYATQEPLSLIERFRAVRADTVDLCLPLETEDMVVSSMEDVSPTKWHLAHTSWFFETFILIPYSASYNAMDSRYAFLFNSYYEGLGIRHDRAQRGLATRPTVAEVFAYREYVDQGVEDLCESIAQDVSHPAWNFLELGVHHEQQHQELLLTDIKHVFWTNPIRPAYKEHSISIKPSVNQRWGNIKEGIYKIGHTNDEFAFDNERPVHKTYLQEARLAHYLVTNAEYADFINDGGYQQPNLWLSNGWSIVQSQQWTAPLYWEQQDGEWYEFTLFGNCPVNPSAPVCHVSYYEADAFARWAGFRLPTEAEWEIMAASRSLERINKEVTLHPRTDKGNFDIQQLFGEVWQWTQSPYIAYPGFRCSSHPVGEYNGKFMCDQWVLRGSSCVTPPFHSRPTYRNFFPSAARWQFSGIRLAADASVVV